MTFLDTGFLFALVSKRDAHHSRVVEVFRTLKDLRLVDHLLTTNHVISETITLTRKVGHDDAARLGDQLYGERLARIHWATPDEERAAFDYFKRHQDQAYSAVDCLSLSSWRSLVFAKPSPWTRTSHIGSSRGQDHSEADAPTPSAPISDHTNCDVTVT